VVVDLDEVARRVTQVELDDAARQLDQVVAKRLVVEGSPALGGAINGFDVVDGHADATGVSTLRGHAALERLLP
jgi:hypothetical protein